MKRLIISVIIAGFPWFVNGQNAAEVFVGHKGVAFELLNSNDLDSARRWNLFTIARFETSYEKDSLSTPDFYTVNPLLTYAFTKNIGLSAGGYYSFDQFVPQVALNITYFNEKGLFLNLFPTLEVQENPNFEIFGIINFSPRLSTNWKLYTQVLFGTNFNTKEHNISYQLIRVGLDYKGFQFGLGGNIREFSSDWIYSGNYGVFIRKNFSVY